MPRRVLRDNLVERNREARIDRFRAIAGTCARPDHCQAVCPQLRMQSAQNLLQIEVLGTPSSVGVIIINWSRLRVQRKTPWSDGGTRVVCILRCHYRSIFFIFDLRDRRAPKKYNQNKSTKKINGSPNLQQVQERLVEWANASESSPG